MYYLWVILYVFINQPNIIYDIIPKALKTIAPTNNCYINLRRLSLDDISEELFRNTLDDALISSVLT